MALQTLGGKCVYACDIDKYCREVYFNNFGIQPDEDITKVNEKDIPEHDVLCAGFPCQPFSIGGKQMGFEDKTRGTLFFDIMRIVNYHKPKYLLLENVKNLYSHNDGNTWKTIYSSLIEAGYDLLEKPTMFSPHYIGILQNRERVIIMCVRKDVGTIKKYEFDKKNIKPCTIDSVLLDDKDIENIERYKLNKDLQDLLDLWGDFLANIKQPLPGFTVFARRFFEEYQNIVAKPSSEKDIRKTDILYQENKDFIEKWKEKSKKVKMFKESRMIMEYNGVKTTAFNMDNHIVQLRQSGVRIKTATYFPCLVASIQTPIVYKRKRYITPRECARLQSFPDSFKIHENDRIAYKQFGNSVNIEVIKLFAKHMLATSEDK
ncbi:MAG: DNA (cytosine-5-)-methyltransferase [Bacteroidales bacterium]|nr:DNA (cytosine-5-)-methyltransferase [Bacteroidales bacterium]